MAAKFIALALAVSALAGCGAKNDNASALPDGETGAADAQTERTLVDRNAGHSDLAPSQKVGGAEGRSPFEGDRVVGLNAIVRRSLEISREFDKAAPAIRAAVDAAAAGGDRAPAETGIKTISDLYDGAKSALDDMAKAEQDLKASGEFYDDSIFYGMQKFVADVEAEIGEEKTALNAKLGG